MSQSDTDSKQIFLNIKDLSFKSEQYVVDLIRYLNESLPQLQITREAMELEIMAPIKLSKRVIKLRIKKFLYRKKINGEYRPISMRDVEKDGYIIKEKKMIELSYY